MRKSAKPLHLALKQSLIRKIREGEYPENSKLPPQIQLAEDWGISTGTVSKAIQELVREGYLSAKPKQGARVRLPRDQSQASSVGILCNQTYSGESYFFGTLSSRLQAWCQAQRTELNVIGVTRPDPSDYRHYRPIEELYGRRFLGLVTFNIMNLAYLLQVKQLSAPVVVLDRDAIDIGMDCVIFDNVKAAYDLTRCMVEDGHKRLGFLGTILPTTESNLRGYDPATSERLRGFHMACDEGGIAPKNRCVVHCRDADDYRNLHCLAHMGSPGSPVDALLTELSLPRHTHLIQERAKTFSPHHDMPLYGWGGFDAKAKHRPSFRAYVQYDIQAMVDACHDILNEKIHSTTSSLHRVILSGDLHHLAT